MRQSAGPHWSEPKDELQRLLIDARKRPHYKPPPFVSYRGRGSPCCLTDAAPEPIKGPKWPIPVPPERLRASLPDGLQSTSHAARACARSWPRSKRPLRRGTSVG